MEKKPVYSIFPAAPTTAHPSQQQQQQQTQQKPRQSTESRSRASLDESPYTLPCSPLPLVPRPHASLDPSPVSLLQQLPPTPDSLRSVQLPSRRRASPNREFADFQRELAQSSSTSSQRSFRQSSPPRGRPRSPKERSSSGRDDRPPLQSTQSRGTTDSIDPEMQSTMLSNSSSSSFSLSKPPLLSPTTTVAPSPHPSQGRFHRPNTVYFHGSIGGAGNYRKVISENKRAPRAYAANAEPVRRSSPTRLLSSMFGKQKAKGIDTGGPAILDERASSSEDSVREEVDLGAAEALRRKMMGMGRRKKVAS